jgi:hypothetical protein
MAAGRIALPPTISLATSGPVGGGALGERANSRNRPSADAPASEGALVHQPDSFGGRAGFGQQIEGGTVEGGECRVGGLIHGPDR